MSWLSIDLQKMKGQIVYRGDCAQDEEGAAAVYRELGANPTSVQGLNACMAYGALLRGIPEIELSNLDRIAARTATHAVTPKVCSSCSTAA